MSIEVEIRPIDETRVNMSVFTVTTSSCITLIVGAILESNVAWVLTVQFIDGDLEERTRKI